MMSKSGLAKEENEGNVVITMWEIPDETPRLVCYCVPRKQTGSPCWTRSDKQNMEEEKE